MFGMSIQGDLHSSFRLAELCSFDDRAAFTSIFCEIGKNFISKTAYRKYTAISNQTGKYEIVREANEKAEKNETTRIIYS
ncbi:MAG TPA: hypothetical protein VI981_04110, partial [Candidatus Paceibacterota bacterium]